MTSFFALLVFFATSSPAELYPGVQNFLKNVQSAQITLPGSQLTNRYHMQNPEAEAAIVFLTGMGESGIKYFDLAQDLGIAPNSAFYWWDHTGQGFSSHLLPQATEKIYIDTYETYLRTLENFFVELRKHHSKITVVAHSMGGHIALRVAQRHPDWFDKLFLSAPMIGINNHGVPEFIIELFLSSFSPTSYLPFYSFFKKTTQNGNDAITHDRERVAIYKTTQDAFPQIKREAVTAGWVLESFKSIHILESADFSHLKTPVFMMQAEEDVLVDGPAQKSLCQKIPKCRFFKIKGSKHEILFEIAPIRNQAIELIKNNL